MMAHPRPGQNKRMLDQFVGDDEWDDLPLANRSPSRRRLQSPRTPAPGLSSGPNPAVRARAATAPLRNDMVLQSKPGSKPRSAVVRKPQQQQLLQSTSNRKSRRRLKQRQPRPSKLGSTAAARPQTKPSAAAVSGSRATVVEAPPSTRVLPVATILPAAAPKLNGANDVQNGSKIDDRSRSGCRHYEAGFCPQGDRDCPLLHDGRAAVENEVAWLRAPLPGIMDWRYLEEVRFRHNGALPAIHPGVPRFLVIVDAPNKQNVPELVCLAMETSTGRQVGRFRRLMRVFPQPSPSPQQQQSLLGAPPNDLLVNGSARSSTAVSGSVSATTGATLVLPATGAASGVKPNQGSRNPVSTALPLPELLLELQRWMVALGLDPGLQDDKGLSECGNFRWIVCGDLGLTMIPELAGQRENMPLPAHLRSWTDLTRVCAWEADAHQAWYDSGAHKSMSTIARRRPKQHCLPRSGLGGMLKFLGPPKEANAQDRTRRGVESVLTLAQCVACLVRAGVAMPITTRVTQVWNPMGQYEETRCEEVHVLPPARTFSAPCNVSVVGPLASPALGLSPSKGPSNGRVGGGGGVNRLEMVEGGSGRKKNPKKVRNAPKMQRMEAGGRGGGGGTLGMNLPAGMGEGRPDGGGAGLVLGGAAHRMMVPVGGTIAPVGGGGIAGVSVGVVGLPNWRRSVPAHTLSPDYLDYSIREKEREFYKSAGILPYRHDPVTGEAWILLGSEVRRNKLVLSCLGGKREDNDRGPEHTAWREFWEESGKVLRDHDRATFLSACFEGRARAMWIQSAKMAVLACELNTPGFVDLPRWYSAGGRSVDKGDTSMIALHWVSATELHRACHKNGRKVTVWMPPRKPGDPGGAPAPSGVMAAPRMPAQSMPAPSSQQRWHKGPAQRNLRERNRPRGRDSTWGGRGPDFGDLDDVSVGGDLDELRDGPGPGAPFMPGGQGGPPGPVLSLPLQLPLPKRQQVKQHQMVPPSMVQVALEPYHLLRSLVADPAFQLFFAQLAAAGKNNQRFVPPSRMMNNRWVAGGGGGSSRMGAMMPAF